MGNERIWTQADTETLIGNTIKWLNDEDVSEWLIAQLDNDDAPHCPQ